jgi:3-methyl-2-oxobutanoate hydroxymethyltransferase
MQEGGAHAVKLEGGRTVAATVERLVNAGVPVLGHIGLTPQSVHALGGYRLQGKTPAAAAKLIADALALQEAGAFGVVLELVPAPLATYVTSRLQIPTIGIGAGAGCDGQVQVWHDLLGFGEEKVGRHARRYAALNEAIRSALRSYVQDVRSAAFPDAEHSFQGPSDLRDFLADLDKGEAPPAADQTSLPPTEPPKEKARGPHH